MCMYVLMCWLELQSKRKYLDASEVPEWMRFSKKELEEKQKQVKQAMLAMHCH